MTKPEIRPDTSARIPTSPPTIGPGTVVVLAGPDVAYVAGSLETNGADAVLRLRTVDGREWFAPR